MGLSPEADVREGFLELYRDLFSHISYLETVIEGMVHGQRVDRITLENHLTQMIASISMSLKKHTPSKAPRRPRRNHPEYFRYEMIRVTKVIKGQLAVLLKTSFLVETGKEEDDYLQTLSDAIDNVAGAFQHVVRSNVLMPVMLN